MKATWNGSVVATSDDTVIVEGNHYFPREALAEEANFQPSATTTYCPWKGTAHYFDLIVDGEINRDAAWHYPAPKPAAAAIIGRVAFWHGVEVTA